ncbi:MAG: hypothetical protein COB53_07625 [Elusimicrobia bacterium]|nr:MAG: hypothetical protein COB53_07625 [Elusimicrobiota bacterium]
MAHLLLTDLNAVVHEAELESRPSDKRELRTIAFFDLCGSTGMKVDHGHGIGSAMVMLHNSIVARIAARFDGRLFKELGDGALCEFVDPLKACLAALNFKMACTMGNNPIASKAAITLGMVEVHEDGDLIGAAVDKSARIQSLAQPNQILIDGSVNDAVKSMLVDFPDIMVSESAKANLKGVGETEVMEITYSEAGFAVTTEHFGGTISPVLAETYPTFSDPATHLICDVCEGALKEDGEGAGIIVLEAEEGLAVRLFHKDTCARSGWSSAQDLADLSNPVEYSQFLAALLKRLVDEKKSLAETKGVVRVLFGMYRKVYRPTLASEQADFDLGSALRDVGL